MSAPATPHLVAADGYCSTCQTVPCALGRRRYAADMPAASQLDRIEFYLRRVLRAVDPDALETPVTAKEPG